mgnify:CR=1 FL=1
MELTSSIVSVDWLNANIELEHLIVLDASIPKAGDSINSSLSELQIPKSRFFDLKNKFSKQDAKFPNTVPSAEQFQREARNLGINSNSLIVIYDNLGVYSSPRAWWLFKLMGFDAVAVLNGGLPAWNRAMLRTEKRPLPRWHQGNFMSHVRPDLLTTFKMIQSRSNTIKMIDARSKDRFLGIGVEPREGLRCGSIPNSLNLPYSEILEGASLLEIQSLKAIFSSIVKLEDKLVFSCGSGVTACILALAADISGYEYISVYDGSWTEWGSLTT